MKSLGILDRLDDKLNPIVVKELRQAVQSKFVIVVLLLFLLVQVAYIGIYLVATGFERGLQTMEAESGRSVFSVLQVILVLTCLVFLPAYTGIRLAAERSDTNVDLLFISTLKPRAIIWGKSVAALVLAVLIFSACTPFMTFAYLLRGIDVPSILLVVGIDFLTVAATVQLALFLAVVPANWVVKALLGLVGLGVLVVIVVLTLMGTMRLLVFGVGAMLDSLDFWAILSCTVVSGLGIMGLFYSWSVALINPPSANRGLGMRLAMLTVWAVTALVFGLWNALLLDAHNGPLVGWVCFMGGLSCLAIIIAINEREQWAPRLTRTIPRRWWLRVPAFLFYSGAAGGVLFGLLLFGLTCLAVEVCRRLPGTVLAPARPRFPSGTDDLQIALDVITMAVLYTFDYAMAAVLLRRLLVKVRGVYTWVLMLVLVALGSAAPFLVSFLLLFRDWRMDQHYYTLLGNPFVAVGFAGDPRPRLSLAGDFFLFAGVSAAVLTLLNVPWLARQIRAFKPYSRRTAAPEPPLVVAASQMDVTKTAG
jgi:hypothetical protein